MVRRPRFLCFFVIFGRGGPSIRSRLRSRKACRHLARKTSFQKDAVLLLAPKVNKKQRKTYKNCSWKTTLKKHKKTKPQPPVNLDSKRTGKHTNKKNKRGGRRRRRRTARLKKKGCRAMVSRLCWKLMWSSAAPAARPRPRFPRGSLLAPFSEKQKPRGRIEIRPHFSRFPATPRPQNHQKQPT